MYLNASVLIIVSVIKLPYALTWALNLKQGQSDTNNVLTILNLLLLTQMKNYSSLQIIQIIKTKLYSIMSFIILDIGINEVCD